MNIEISNGELIDKYTILRIKQGKITDDAKLANVAAELDLLSNSIEELKARFPGIEQAITALQNVNVALWDIENSIREKEQKKEFDDAFIQLARSVYLNNDQRAHIKKVINDNTGTPGEVKQYSEYQA
jgi:hypothetical protein